MPDRAHEVETLEIYSCRFAYQPRLRRRRAEKFWQLLIHFFAGVGAIVLLYRLWVML